MIFFSAIATATSRDVSGLIENGFDGDMDTFYHWDDSVTGRTPLWFQADLGSARVSRNCYCALSVDCSSVNGPCHMLSPVMWALLGVGFKAGKRSDP